MRILMGTYALSAGYYDAYYKRAQQVGKSYHSIFNFFILFWFRCLIYPPIFQIEMENYCQK